MMPYHGQCYTVHGVGYCAETNTLAEALAVVERMKGGTVYERLNRWVFRRMTVPGETEGG
jgi:hypothetical protein